MPSVAVPAIETRQDELYDVPQLSIRRAIALHLLPGLPVVIAYAIGAAVCTAIDAPKMFALAAAGLFVEAPILWAIMFRLGRDKDGARSWKRILPYRNSLPLWQYFAIGLPLILVCTILMGLSMNIIQPLLMNGPFAWVPDWFVMDMNPAMLLELSRPTLIFMWAFGFIAMVLVAGPAQEIYFRGFLLPRIEWMGPWAPVFNAGLFGVYHFAALWISPTFALISLIWTSLVWWKRSLKLGLVIHIGMLALQSLGLALLAFGVINPGH